MVIDILEHSKHNYKANWFVTFLLSVYVSVMEDDHRIVGLITPHWSP